jgi:hypothetical protein
MLSLRFCNTLWKVLNSESSSPKKVSHWKLRNASTHTPAPHSPGASTVLICKMPDNRTHYTKGIVRSKYEVSDTFKGTSYTAAIITAENDRLRMRVGSSTAEMAGYMPLPQENVCFT